MKIISWNCKMAYRNKANLLSRYNPDIIIVPECEWMGEGSKRRLWFGDNCKKGLGIFSHSDYTLELNEYYDPSFKYVIPINVTGPYNFNLFAIWAMNNSENIRRRYIGQVYSAINQYSELLNRPTIIIGDFNWNAIWDIKPGSPLDGNLADVIKILASCKIRSTYHGFFTEDFGKETRPTFYMHHKQNKPYHIDYCFASSDFDIGKVEIGSYSDWINKSDHMPLMITLYGL